MEMYIDLTLVALVTIYIVDVSGFTTAWRSALARMLNVRNLRPLPPFDCAKCMTWWVCIIYAAIVGEFTLPAIAFSALMSFMAYPVGQLFHALRERVLIAINKIFPDND